VLLGAENKAEIVFSFLMFLLFHGMKRSKSMPSMKPSPSTTSRYRTLFSLDGGGKKDVSQIEALGEEQEEKDSHRYTRASEVENQLLEDVWDASTFTSEEEINLSIEVIKGTLNLLSFTLPDNIIDEVFLRQTRDYSRCFINNFIFFR